MTAFSPIGSRFLSFSGTFGNSGPLFGLSLKTRPASTARSIERFAPTVPPEIAALREALRKASDGVKTTGASLAAATKTGRVTTRVFVPGAAAVRRGVLGTLGTFSILATTREVNRQTSTIRFSGGPLSLDVASPETASSIQSSAGLGLDVTSPEAPSTLESSGALGLDVTSPAAPSSIESSESLGLDVASPESVSTLTSTAEANTAPTSYGAVQLTFSSGGTPQSSRGNLSGVYAGTGAAANATSLNLRVALGGTIGGSPTFVAISVTDQNSTNLGTYSGLVQAGDKLGLGDDIGLEIAFSAGSLATGSTSSVSVSRNTPTDVDPNAVFNDADVNLRPRFENGAQVVEGAFIVNGTSVQVLENDTITSVLARINSTVAGVSASFGGDKVTIVTTAPSEDDIVLADDTSGFLSALKLTGATTVTGNVRDDLQILSKTTQFSSVANGSFTVNGVAISVDRVTDSLQSVISRINALIPGVTALYDSVLDRVRLTTTESSEDDFVFTEGGTGFVAAAKLDTAVTTRGNIADDVQILKKTSQFGSVASGSFTVNGVSISIDRDVDTLQSVIERINAPATGVTALYDSASDKIRLTTTADTEDEIVVADGGTGFLAAARLDDAVTSPGNIRDDVQTLGKTTQFGSVSSGSFTVNGVAISVDRDADTLQSVIARISGSAAGVTAIYDAESDRITLTTLANTEDDIVFDDDGTGFVAAAKLDEAVTARGNIRDDVQTLAKTTQFSSVASGSFAVNGVSISVDRDSDTLQSVISRINTSGAGVTASYDAGTDLVSIAPDVAGSTLVVDGDTSGFLSAIGVFSGPSGTAVNPDARFDATSADAPLFEDGVSVGAGSFLVNGKTILVAASDTLSSVLEKIAASGANVAAAFDAETEKITLTAKVAGNKPIALSGDTSGFLAAVGLDGTESLTPGALTYDSPLSSHAVFASVAAGNITVNGTAVAVDPDTDSLEDVLAALSEISGVRATLDTSTGAVVLRSVAPGGSLEIADETGLLSVVDIETGTVAGRASSVKSVVTAIEKRILSYPETAANLSAAVAEAAEALNKIFSSSEVSAAYKGVLADAVRAATEKTEAAWKTGVEFVERGSVFEFKVDAELLAEALREDPAALETFLEGANALPNSLEVVEVAISDTVVAGIGVMDGSGLDSTLSLRELGNSLSSSSLVAKLSLFSAAGLVGPRTGAFYDRSA